MGAAPNCRVGRALRGAGPLPGGVVPVSPQPTFIFLIMETWLVRCRRKVIIVRSLSGGLGGMWAGGERPRRRDLGLSMIHIGHL